MSQILYWDLAMKPTSIVHVSNFFYCNFPLYDRIFTKFSKNLPKCTPTPNERHQSLSKCYCQLIWTLHSNMNIQRAWASIILILIFTPTPRLSVSNQWMLPWLKNLLLVLKRTVSMRQFYWAHKTHVQFYGQENNHNLMFKNWLIWIYV